MVLTTDDIPPFARPLVAGFEAGLHAALGSTFAGLFCYGSVCFQPSPMIDLDAHVLLTDALTDEQRRAVAELHGRLDDAHPPVEELDTWYITLDAARSADKPRSELKPSKVDGMWAIHRAHVHAGRYISVFGSDPRELLPVPDWTEIADELDDELDDLDRAISGGYHAYATLNLSRVHCSFVRRDVVISKMDAARWALGSLEDRWHALIRAAIRHYLREQTDEEDELLARDTAPFREMLRDRIERERALSSPLR